MLSHMLMEMKLWMWRSLYKNMGSFSMYYEANGIKKLFSKSEIQIAYTNFVKDLKAFYAYE